MEKKLKRYKISKDSETYAVSLVDCPAIEVDFVYFNEQKPMIFKNDEKHIVLGPALVPNKPIYRRLENEEFEVVFESDVIEKMAYEFMSKERTNSITLDHLDFAEDVSIVESWLKLSENDKSNDYGFDCPIGTWFIAMKINNDDTWNRIKNGELKGFSIESLVSLDEYNFNKIENNMISEMFDEASFLDKIKNIIKDALKTKEFDKPEEEIVEDTANEVVAAVETETPIVEEAVEEVVEETPEEIVNEVIETVVDDVETESQAVNELQAVVDGLNIEIEALKNEIEVLRKQNEELGKQPSAKPIVMHSDKQNPFDLIRELRNQKL